MRRWNGWGDDGIEFALNDEALAFLQQRIGSGIAGADASHAQACAQLKHTRLPWHPLVNVTPAARLASALGQSLPDCLVRRAARS